jgi:uncharacterized protein (DUF1015 family)
MADFQPFRALRYDPRVAGDPKTLIAPPYDVVSPAERQEMYLRGPFNISLVDYGEEEPGDNEAENRYTRARDDVEAWRQIGVLRQDETPRLYAYDQEFSVAGKTLRRRAIFGRLRLEEWEKGVILPHENTRPREKADRLQLLQATRVHLSPILAMYRLPDGGQLADAALGDVLLDAWMPDRQRHTLRSIRPEAAQRFCAALADQRLYIADGHHRYETALNYRDERRAAAPAWTGDEPENFVLAALVDVSDPGLVVLPTHRLLKLDRPADLSALASLFDVTEVGPADEATLSTLLAQMRAPSDRNVLGAAGLEPGKLHLITARDTAAIDATMPPERAPAWRRLDVAVLHQVVLSALGLAASPERLAFHEDARHVLDAVQSGEWDAGLLLNPTPVEQVLAVAEAGERMPEKSTYFYPKLATGLVMYPFD